MLSALVTSKAVGYSTGQNKFDDLVEVGKWPTYQFIQKLVKIRVWVGADKINCLEATYRLSSDTTDTPKQHGQPVGRVFTVDLTIPNGKSKNAEDQYFVGMFGSVANKEDAPVLKRLGFLVYDRATGIISPFGPYPTSEASGVKGFTSLGAIIGFSGSLGANQALETLGIYKHKPGAKVFGVTKL
ncbi:hypothetical protein LshimejAT787_2000250 [Lyophyllum shimeji]|uniref:Jacalin-type lectin domain-containing protein n=1 Tax=Lyophyllum shimeji TaxID=47721 RepID=A0A9P3PY00_LYOSH|nr:hypothetical protein LshimejAT787_2000250 [Lyophyllum shimeji]